MNQTPKKPTPYEIAIDAALARFGVTCVIESAAQRGPFGYVSPIDRDGWKCYPWHATFTWKNARSNGHYTADYFTGIGNVRKRSAAYYRAAPIPIKPHAADVLYSLLLDGAALDTSFKNWCDDIGESDDSLKALRVYQQCCDIGAQMHKIFDSAQRAELATILEGF